MNIDPNKWWGVWASNNDRNWFFKGKFRTYDEAKEQSRKNGSTYGRIKQVDPPAEV